MTDDSTGRPQAHDRIGIVGGTAIGTPDTTQTIPEPPDYARDVLPQETVGMNYLYVFQNIISRLYV